MKGLISEVKFKNKDMQGLNYTLHGEIIRPFSVNIDTEIATCNINCLEAFLGAILRLAEIEEHFNKDKE